MQKAIIGTSALPGADVERMKEAGIDWLRHGFPYPLVGRLGGELSPGYAKARDEAVRRSGQGFRLMGVTPGLGIGTMEVDAEGLYRLVWHDRYPSWMDTSAIPGFLRGSRELCAWPADDLQGLLQMWQNLARAPPRAVGPDGPAASGQGVGLFLGGGRAAGGARVARPDLPDTPPAQRLGEGHTSQVQAAYVRVAHSPCARSRFSGVRANAPWPLPRATAGALRPLVSNSTGIPPCACASNVAAMMAR